MFRALPCLLFLSATAAAPAIAQPMQAQAARVDALPSIEVTALSWRAAADVQPQVMTSDPQEGGEVARSKGRKKTGVSVGEMTVTKPADVSSTKLMRTTGGASEPGKLEIPNMKASSGATEPPDAGTATITVARGHCASGQHFPAVKLTMRGESHTLQDVEVVGCTPVGDDADRCTLSYRSVSG